MRSLTRSIGAAAVLETAAETPPTEEIVSFVVQLCSVSPFKLLSLLVAVASLQVQFFRADSDREGHTQEINHEWGHAHHGLLLLL